MGANFRILHFSDLHFSNGRDCQASNHSHSIDMCSAISSFVKNNNDFDKVIISGDISDGGDRESLLTAHDWIMHDMGIGAKERIGLRLNDNPQKLGIVPGNHDAWNNRSGGKLISRWQKSLENYNSIFTIRSLDKELSCIYDWIEKDGVGVFIAYVDSCYFGDDDNSLSDVSERVARGKLSSQQAKILLNWYDRGLKGKLQKPNEEFISSSLFRSSLKIVVMHHYLFEPQGLSEEGYFLKIKDKKNVFSNIAMADFDVLLCGHRHIADSKESSYGDHFDRRARNRYMFNCFRRLMGIDALPLQFDDKQGVRLTKKLSAVIQILWRKFRMEKRHKNLVQKYRMRI